jgi:hypothetical protein
MVYGVEVAPQTAVEDATRHRTHNIRANIFLTLFKSI